jgi:hypothetical protein
MDLEVIASKTIAPLSLHHRAGADSNPFEKNHSKPYKKA